MGWRKRLEYQADQIEAVLAAHRCPGRVTGGRVTPWLIRFDVIPRPGVRVAAVKALAEELALTLNVPTVRVARRGAAIAVEVPRTNPPPIRLLPLLRTVTDIPPVTAILGMDEEGVPLLIRLSSPSVAHVLVAGTTGSGKTALLRTMALSLALRHPNPRGLALVMMDPRGSGFGRFDGLPHLSRPVIRDAGEAVEALASLVRLMERRDRRGETAPPVVVFIDELADLLMVGGKEAEGHLTRLAQRGRGAGIHLVAATQKPTATAVGSLVKANFPARLVGKVASVEDARVAAGRSGTGAERLDGRGDFLAIAGGRVIRFKAAYVTEAELEETLDRLGRVRSSLPPGGNGRGEMLEGDVETLGEARPMKAVQVVTVDLPDPPEPHPDQIEVLAERLRPWWERHGGEWGAKTRAVKVLFGKDAPPGGHFWEMTMRAIERLENSTSTTPQAMTWTDADGWAAAFLEW